MAQNFAVPGRWPLDSKQNVKIAWHQFEASQWRFLPEEATQIRDRIKAAWAEFFDGAQPPYESRDEHSPEQFARDAEASAREAKARQNAERTTEPQRSSPDWTARQTPMPKP